MTGLLFLFAILLAAGLFFLLCDLLKFPTLAASKALLNAGREKKNSAKSMKTYLMASAVKLSKFIHMDEYKRSRLANTLKAAGNPMTPELYTAYAIVKGGAIAVLVIPCLFLFPLLAPVLILLAALIYFREIRKADEQLKVKREKIESELPRLVATIEQSLKSSRDVLAMLEHYKQHAGEAFANELGILTADMRSSSYEAALTRFEARFNSPRLSDVVRGLIGVLRGDDGAVYFQMLSHDFKALELQRLRGEALKIPPKIRVHSFVMLMCFLLTWLAVMGIVILSSLSTMF